MATDPLHEVTRALRAGVADLGHDDLVLVACSGGPDSLALAAAASRIAPRPESPRFGAIVVDHRMQAGSDNVAAVAAECCRGLGLHPVDVEAVDVATGPGSGGPEAAARAARRDALERAAGRHGARAVLLAHTLDDQAETVLLGLARGSGGRSLAGMAAADGLWRRPLLAVRRHATAAAAAQAGLKPFMDPQNADDRFARSRVRMRVMPVLEAELGPGVADALARTAAMLRADCDSLDDLAARWLREHGMAGDAVPKADSAATALAQDLDEAAVADLAEVPRSVRTRVLRRLAIAAGAPPAALTFDHVMAVDQLVMAWRGQGPVALPGRVTAMRRGSRITLR